MPISPTRWESCPDGRILVQLAPNPFIMRVNSGRNLPSGNVPPSPPPATNPTLPFSIRKWRRFSIVKPPLGYKPKMFFRLSNGTFLLAMVATDNNNDDALAILDGDSISKPVSIHAKWNIGYWRAMAEDGHGDLWVEGRVAWGALRMANISNSNSAQAARNGFKTRNAVKPRSVFSLFFEPDGTMLVGGRDGLYRWTGSQLEFLTDRIQVARGTIRDASGILWIVSGSGVFPKFEAKSIRDRIQPEGMGSEHQV